MAQRLHATARRVDEIYQIVVESAVQLIDGCDRAAIGVLDGEQFRSAAATDDVMRLIDRLQNEVGEGPCLEASTDSVVQVDNDITTDSQVAAAGRRSWSSGRRSGRCSPCRSCDEGQRSGALNVFADTAGAFTDESVGQAAILASFASVALAGARHVERGRPARGGHGDQPRDRRRRRHPDGHAQHQPGRRRSTCCPRPRSGSTASCATSPPASCKGDQQLRRSSPANGGRRRPERGGAVRVDRLSPCRISSGSGRACTGRPRPRRCTRPGPCVSLVSLTPSASRCSRATFSSRCFGST